MEMSNSDFEEIKKTLKKLKNQINVENFRKKTKKN